jgi:sugar phosphate isomerase/epimerase
MRAADNLARIADLAAAARLTAVVEGPIYGRLINTLPLVLKLVNDAGRDNIVVCIDTYQLFRSGDDVALLGQQPSSTLPYLQLTDGKAEPVQFLVPGSGSVPLRQILDQLPADVTIALECPAPKDSDVRPADWARTLLAGARDVVNRGSKA